MTLSLFRRTNPIPTRRPRTTRRHFALESLEDRLVMSHATIAPPALPPVHVAPSAHNAVSVPISITGVTLTSVTPIANSLGSTVAGTVTGLIDGLPFTTQLTLGTSSTPGTVTSAAVPAVPVLNLHLAPIDLNILGLEVKTSEICLNITAQPGPGNLLGNLVGDIANLLNGTTTAGTTGLLSTLTSDLTTTATGAVGTGSSSVLGLLNSAVGSALGQMTPSAATGSAAGVTNLIHLSVGPLNLNLLGLVVNLDNCSGGPVTVDVNAIAGPGNLLGNLLTGVAGLLNGPGKHPGLLGQIDNTLIGLIGLL